MIALVLAWVTQAIGIGASASFLVIYTVTTWKPWQGRRPDDGARQARRVAGHRARVGRDSPVRGG